MDVSTDELGQKHLRISGAHLVFAVGAFESGPRVALGAHATNRDNAVIALAAIAAELAQRHGWDAAELLQHARGHSMLERRTEAGLILPVGRVGA